MPAAISERIQQLLDAARGDGLAAIARRPGLSDLDRAVLAIVAKLEGDRQALAALRVEAAPAVLPARRRYTVRGEGGDRS